MNTKICNIDIKYENAKIEEYITKPEDAPVVEGNESTNILLETVDKSNIVISYDVNDEEELLENHVVITCMHDSNIVVIYKNTQKIKANIIPNIKVVVKQNIEVNVDIVNLLADEINILGNIKSTIGEKSNLNINLVDLGAKNSSQSINMECTGRESTGKIKVIYMGENEESKNINCLAKLFGEKSSVDIEVQGTLNDKAQKDFKGTICFENGAKKSKGTENENCILFSEDAISKSLPILLCREEDVEGSHSSSSGKIDEHQVFYLQTRGIDKKEANKILVKAKFKSILENVRDEKIREEIEEIIERKLV